MFSLLNERYWTGKHRARMCKFLVCLSQFFHLLWQCFTTPFYLIEDARLRSQYFALVGHRIAFLPRQPVLLEIRCRKD